MKNNLEKNWSDAIYDSPLKETTVDGSTKVKQSWASFCNEGFCVKANCAKVSENPTEGRLSKKGKLMQNTTKAQELTAAIIKNDETKHKLGESSTINAFNEREKHISIRTPCGGNEKVLTFSTNYVMVWGLWHIFIFLLACSFVGLPAWEPKMPPTSTVDNMEENTEFACQKKIHLCKNDLNIAVGRDNKRCHK